MLRRTKTIVLKDDIETDPAEESEVLDIEPAGLRRTTGSGGTVGTMQAEIERAFGAGGGSALGRAQPAAAEAAREPQEIARPEAGVAAAPKVERRKTERRGMDSLREEALRNIISMVEDKNFGGLRDKARWRARMPRSRLVLLGVAVLAGGAAIYLAMQADRQPVPRTAGEPTTQMVQEARTKILVAKEAIGIGQRLSPASLEWQDWPEGAVRSDYVTIAMVPDAMTQMAGSVARYEIFPGEPIREQKLATSAEGFLSAVLGSGMRGVSVSVSAASASGGFIFPNDHVDVVLTRGPDAARFSETILRNVRVLAIDARLADGQAAAEPESPTAFEGEAIATLELDPTEAEVIIGAAHAGELSLVLRSILDSAEIDSADHRPSNQAIRLSSPFWSN